MKRNNDRPFGSLFDTDLSRTALIWIGVLPLLLTALHVVAALLRVPLGGPVS